MAKPSAHTAYDTNARGYWPRLTVSVLYFYYSLAEPRLLNPRAGEGLVYTLPISQLFSVAGIPATPISDCRIFTRDVYPPTLYVNRRGYLLRTHGQELSHTSLLSVNTTVSRLWPVVYIALGVEGDWDIKGRMREEFSTPSPAKKVQESCKLLLASVDCPIKC